VFNRNGGWVRWRFDGLVGGSVLGVSLYRRPGVTTRGERAFVSVSGAFLDIPRHRWRFKQIQQQKENRT